MADSECGNFLFLQKLSILSSTVSICTSLSSCSFRINSNIGCIFALMNNQRPPASATVCISKGPISNHLDVKNVLLTFLNAISTFPSSIVVSGGTRQNLDGV